MSITGMYDDLYAYGGFTRSNELGSPTKGFSVAMPGGTVFGEMPGYVTFKSVVSALLSDGYSVGGWLDTETGKVYIEPIRIYQDLNAALKAAEHRGELAIYDLAEQKEIRIRTS